MKQLIILFYLFAATAAQAQTKQETIEWINLYSGDYLKAETSYEKDKFSMKVDTAGRIIVFREMKWKVDNSLYRHNRQFQASDIVSINLQDRPTDGLYYLFINTKSGAISDSDPNNAGRSDIQIYINSYEDLNRVYKALVKYASFFGYKEKVARDTF